MGIFLKVEKPLIWPCQDKISDFVGKSLNDGFFWGKNQIDKKCFTEVSQFSKKLSHKNAIKKTRRAIFQHNVT